MVETGRIERNLEHATWRVNYLCTLLQAHRLLDQRDDGWRQKEDEYLDRMAQAESELQRWMHVARPAYEARQAAA